MTIDRADVQSFVFRSGPDEGARYLFLEVTDPERARQWLADQLSASQAPSPRLLTAAPRSGLDPFVNVAFTCSGLSAFGLSEAELDGFGHEFREGMDTEHRSRALGDVRESAPANWGWGGSRSPVDVLLMIFADEANRTSFEGEQLDALQGAFEIVADRPELFARATEPFGFRDGISQPLFAGTRLGDAHPEQVVRTGEFILGYHNEHDRFPPTPTVAADREGACWLRPAHDDDSRRDLGRNGSYLVVRQLEQDVASFWSYVENHAGDGAQAGEALAAKLVGRWRDGTPLTLSPEPRTSRSGDRDSEALLGENDFGFMAADAHALRCPVGSHIRRSNPRDSLTLGDAEASRRTTRRHRILRRGRSYGPPAVEPLHEDDEEKRGLMFACLNADIGRQFEFVQQTWVDSPSFGGLHHERDPLIGSQPEGGGAMTVPACPVRHRLTGLPRFVTVRGGAYFFLPSVAALRFLARLPAAPGNAGGC